MTLEPNTQYELYAQASIGVQAAEVSDMPEISEIRQTPESPTQILMFTHTAAARRDELLSVGNAFMEDFEKRRNECDACREKCARLLQRPIRDDDTPTSFRERLLSFEEQLRGREAELDCSRPRWLKGVMPVLSSKYIWRNSPGFLGFVGEFIGCDDVKVAHVLSFVFQKDLSNLLVREEADVECVKRLRREDAQAGQMLRGRRVKEIARLRPRSAAAPTLPHLRDGNLWSNVPNRQQSVAYFNETINGCKRIRVLADLVKPAAGLGLSEDEGYRVVQDVVSTCLVVDRSADALKYSRLVRHHSKILCLDTCELYTQGAAESLDPERPPLARCGNDNSLLLDMPRLHLLRERWSFACEYRAMSNSLAALTELDEKHRAFEAVRAGVYEQQRNLDILLDEERNCKCRGHSLRTADIQRFQKFLVGVSTNRKRPTPTGPSANVHELDEDDYDGPQHRRTRHS